MSRRALINDLDKVIVGDVLVRQASCGGGRSIQTVVVEKVGRSLIHTSYSGEGGRLTPYRKNTGWINQDPGHFRVLTQAMAARESEVGLLLDRLEAATDRGFRNSSVINRLDLGDLRSFVEFWETVSR